MNKKWSLVLAAILLSLSCLALAKPQEADASWGMHHVYTTPKRTRGNWFYKEGRHIKRLHITAHTLNGRRLYKVLPRRQYSKYENKLNKLSESKLLKTYNYFDKHAFQAFTFKFHGTRSFNVNGWLAGAGDGAFYTPVKHRSHHRKVRALRIGHGAYNWLTCYAYRSRKLAR